MLRGGPYYFFGGGEGRGGERDWKILKQNVQGRTILLFRGEGREEGLDDFARNKIMLDKLYFRLEKYICLVYHYLEKKNLALTKTSNPPTLAQKSNCPPLISDVVRIIVRR